MKNLYCTGSLDVKYISSTFFSRFFFCPIIYPYTNITSVSASEVVHSTVDTTFDQKNSAQEAWTLAQWQVYAESPSGVWEVVNENAKHISAYNVQRLDLYNCTHFATCTARDEKWDQKQLGMVVLRRYNNH